MRGDANDITVGGNVYASGFDRAIGIEAYRGDVNVHIGGNVEALTTFGYAIGVDVDGDAYIFVGGNVIAESVHGNATGIYGNSSGYLGEHVDGGVYAASTDDNAIGVFAGAEDLAKIYVGGPVIAKSVDGYATGVKVLAGDVVINKSALCYGVTQQTLGAATGVARCRERHAEHQHRLARWPQKSHVRKRDGASRVTLPGRNTIQGHCRFGLRLFKERQRLRHLRLRLWRHQHRRKGRRGREIDQRLRCRYRVLRDQERRHTGLRRSGGTVGGNIVATGYTGATGVREAVTVSFFRNDYVTVGGNIVVKTINGDAYGVVIDDAETSTANITGSVYVYSKNGDADGVDVIAVTHANTTIGGRRHRQVDHRRCVWRVSDGGRHLRHRR